jgi:hypothetical protein
MGYIVESYGFKLEGPALPRTERRRSRSFDDRCHESLKSINRGRDAVNGACDNEVRQSVALAAAIAAAGISA